MRTLLLLTLSLYASFGIVAQETSTPTPRTLNSYFPFEVPESLEQWSSRRTDLRNHLKTALGLNPFPEKTPLNPVVFGNIDQGDYVIKKVAFESMPGFLVTGNLYQPKNITKKLPAVLCPHGHHRDGRFRSATAAEIDAQIAKGAEKFRNNARSPLQARCAHLAKMGCVVFHYDMIGYADSQQISYQVAHGFRKGRAELNDEQRYGFYSPIAEARGQSIMGLQTWNSIRALDFLESLEEVDMARVGVTGASGGGTQTFMLCALDDRPTVCFPAVMVSTAMQGGCTCENCCNLRVGTGNVEIAAMFAPKPMGLTAADDWTREMESKGFPELQELYRLYAKPEAVQLTARLEFEHNYNQVCREAMYRFFDKHLKLNGLKQETEIEFVDPDRLRVIDETNRPKLSGEDLEAHVLSNWQTLRSDAVESMGLSQEELKSFYRERIADVLCNNVAPLKISKSAQEFETTTFMDSDGYEFQVTILNNSHKGPTLLVLSPTDQMLESLIQQDLNAISIQFKNDEATTRLINNGRDAAGYTFGYNRTQLARRAAQVIEWLETQEFETRKPILVGHGKGLELAMLVASLKPDQLTGLAIQDWDNFGFSKSSLTAENFLPGSLAFGKDAYLVALGDLRMLLGVGKTVPSDLGQSIETLKPADFEGGLLKWCQKISR